MKASQWAEPVLYFVVGITSVILALWVSAQFVPDTRAQKEVTATLETDDPGMQEASTELNRQPLPVGPANIEVPPTEPKTAVPPTKNRGENRGSLLLEIGREFPFLQPYKYDAEGRRDPFRSFAFAGKSTGPNEPVGPILPLQRYDLDDLKLIGIMWDVRSPKAMFLDPNKEVHTLGKDDRIGRNNGYIAVIREGEVVVVEAEKIRDELVYTSRVLKMDR